jgi:Kef-type K+ transport system membrane component KefB
MAERKSKPRKPEPVDEEEKKYNKWFLGMWLFGGIGLILLMFLVSVFLAQSGQGPDSWFYIVLGAVVLLTASFWFAGWLADRKAA